MKNEMIQQINVPVYTIHNVCIYAGAERSALKQKYKQH